MALSLTSMSKYSQEYGFKLVSAAVYKGQTTSVVRVVSGKGDTFKIPTISNTATLQADGCNLSSSATTTLAQATVSLCDIAYVNDMCVKDLRDYYYSEYLPASSNSNDTLGEFEDVFFNNIIEKVAVEVSKIFWEGSVSLGCTGIKQLIVNTAYSASTINITGSTTSTSNIIASVDNIITNFGYDTINEKASIWMSPSNYRKLLVAWRNANFFSPSDLKKDGMEIPGSINMVARPDAGITSDDYMIGIADNNLVFGTLNEEDYMNLSAVHDEYRDLLRVKAFWRQGAQILFPSQVVYWYKV